MKKPTLAVQFVNYKTKKYLAQSLEDVLQDISNEDIDYKVYILENSSGEDLNDITQKRVDLFVSPENIGFGAGHNLLASKHSAEYILILNPDIRLIEKRTIVRLLKSLQDANDGAVIGAKLIKENKKVQRWDHGELDISSGPHSPKSYWENRSQKGEVAWVSGATLLIEATAFRSVDGFDEEFFLYKEEEDLCLRLRKQGLKTYYDPGISIMHYGSVVASKMNQYFEESIRYYNNKHQLDD